MVKRIIVPLILMTLLSSCAFFGSTIFPQATSIDIEWFLDEGDIERFYILNNGTDEELLVLTRRDGGVVSALIFDTSLNIRGYIEDGVDGVTTDGLGFVTHDGSFVIGQTKVANTGSADPTEIELVLVPGLDSNSAVIPYEQDADNQFYIRIDIDGSVTNYNKEWGSLNVQGADIDWENLVWIPQSDLNPSSVKLMNATGDVYEHSKEELYNHGDSSTVIEAPSQIGNFDLTTTTNWLTYCSRGYFASDQNGNIILYDESNFEEIARQDYNGDLGGTVVTIDHDCSYFYVVDEEKNTIRKERVPF